MRSEVGRDSVGRPAAIGRRPIIGPLLAVMALALPLAGCLTADPIDARPDLSARYRAGPGDPGAAPPKVAWWQGFRSVELNRLVEAARVGNQDIAAAVARIAQADAQARIAGSGLLPTLDATADRTRSRASGEGVLVGQGRNQTSLALQASYEIDFWGKNRAALAAARDLAVASRFDRDTVEVQTVSSVASTYFAVLAAQDRLRFARQNAEAATRVLGLVQARATAGTATALDLAEQQSLVGQQRAAVPPLEQIVGQNSATLALLLGKAPANLKVVGGSLDRLASPRITPGLPSDLLLRRPDIRSAEVNLAATQADVVNARAQLFPSINLTAQGGLESLALKSLFEPASTFYSVGAGLTQPIFEGGRLTAQVAQQRGARDERIADYRQAVVQAFSDVEQALIAIRQLARQEALQRDVVASSRQAFDLAEQQLRGGTTDLVTVLQAQQTLFSAQEQLVQVRLSRFQAIVSLVQALGGAWTGSPAPSSIQSPTIATSLRP